MSLVSIPRETSIDASGVPRVGAQWFFYQAGTDTPIPSYTTAALDVEHEIPVESLGNGYFPAVYLNSTLYPTHKQVMLDADGLTVFTEDNLTTSEESVLRADLASAVSGDDGARLIGFRRTEAGSVARTIYERMRERLSVRDFGAKGDGSDDAPAFALAIAACLASNCGLYVPPPEPGSYYCWQSGVTVPLAADFSMVGAGKTITNIKTKGTFTTALTIGSAIGQQIRGHFEGFNIDCRDDTAHGRTTSVQYGILGTRVEEHDFVCVSVYGSTVACWSIGYGYVNNTLFCEASYGDGDGFTTNTTYNSGGNNALTYTGCMALNNGGRGLVLTSGANAVLTGCTIERNAVTGLWANAYAGLKASACHFEKNGWNGSAYVGKTFTSPAQLVKAQVILVGSGTETDMSSAFACAGASFDACRIVPNSAAETAFIFNAGVNSLRVSECGTTVAVPCVAQMYDNTYVGTGCKIEGCPTFTTPVSFIGAPAAVNNNAARFFDIDNYDDAHQVRNYAQTDFNQWANISAAAAATFHRSDGGAALYRFHQTDVWEIETSATSSSHIFGFAFTATDYPELIGKLMQFTLWVNPNDVTRYIRPFCSEQAFNANPTPINTWTPLTVSFTWPAVGTVSFGARKEGAAVAGGGFLAAPLLTVVGVPAKKAIGLIPQMRKQWWGTAPPTLGTWEDGDWVRNSAPAAAGVPGWVCTTPGTPGTWKAEAAVAA